MKQPEASSLEPAATNEQSSLQAASYKLQAGFTLIELLVYTGILILIVAVVGSTLLALSRSYGAIISEQRVDQAAQDAMDRMVREIRRASSINAAASTFNATSSVLSLNSTDTSGNAETVKLYLVGTSTIHLMLNGTDSGPLNPSGATVSALVFRSITTAESSAVKIEMTVSSGTSTSYRSRNFYETAALRGTYVQ